MLEEILNHLHNYFVVKDGVHSGDFQISSSVLNVDFLLENQYYKIEGSVFNDGIHKFGVDELTDEQFSGKVLAMAVPKAVEDIATEILQWCTSNPNNGFITESFGGYSYTKGTRAMDGSPVGWKEVFRDRLNAWRKLS